MDKNEKKKEAEWTMKMQRMFSPDNADGFVEK